jgi:hypothetical protein
LISTKKQKYDSNDQGDGKNDDKFLDSESVSAYKHDFINDKHQTCKQQSNNYQANQTEQAQTGYFINFERDA